MSLSNVDTGMMIHGGKHAEKGVVLVLLAFMAAVLFGFLGLAIDGGNLQWTKLRAQTAADSAAIAALREYQLGSQGAGMVEAARNDAALNGFAHDTVSTSVTINRPPLSGSLAGDDRAVEAVIRRNVPTFFMRYFGADTSSVAGRAVAKLDNGGGCIYALNKTAQDTFVLGGSETTTLLCDAVVASKSAAAFRMMGNSVLNVRKRARVGVVGGWVFDGGALLIDERGVAQSPVHVDSVRDPFQLYPPPALNLPVVSMKKTDASFDANVRPANNRISPGIYCGGLNVGNTQGGTFTMEGVYVMAGGGFSFGSGAKVSGSNVTIYLTSGPRSGVAGCGAAYDAFNINAQAQVKLSAPTAGGQERMEGMLMFQDRNISSTAAHVINGGSGSEFNGAIYLRNSQLNFSGDSSTAAYLILVADKIKIVGNSDVYADYSTLQSGSPLKSLPSLIE